MTDEPSRAASPASPRFIAGVYNFCDAWCERCRFQSRCFSYSYQLRLEAEERGEPLPPEDDEPTEAPGDGSADWRASLEEANREPTEAELEEVRHEETRIRAILDQDRLVNNAKDYMEIVSGLRSGLDPLFELTGDALIQAALEAIGRHSARIAVKVWRACRSRIPTEHRDEEFARDDGNGTAKLVRVMIRESREAWQVLMQPDRAMADGVPARMIVRLDELDEAMAERFPEAMAFVRPGLDE
jgi:hypothetical protein